MTRRVPFQEIFESDGNPTIQREVLPSFRLSSGVILPEVRLGFCVFGSDPTLPLIVLHPALTGSPRAVCVGKASQGDGWWKAHIGPGCLLDTNQFQVLCVDPLGGNGHSTGAVELQGLRDKISFRDTIRLITAVLHRRGLDQIHAVLGGSIGGGQAFEWLFQSEIRINKIFDISGSACSTSDASEFFKIHRDLLWGGASTIFSLPDRLLENHRTLLGITPAYDHVFHYLHQELMALRDGNAQTSALELARKIGFLKFVTPYFYQNKWEQTVGDTGDEQEAFAQLRSWIDHQGRVFPNRFSADALAMLCSMDANAPALTPQAVARALGDQQIQLYGFAVLGDVLFNPLVQRDFYAAVQEELGGDATLVEFVLGDDKVNGHDHFLCKEFHNTVAWFREQLGLSLVAKVKLAKGNETGA